MFTFLKFVILTLGSRVQLLQSHHPMASDNISTNLLHLKKSLCARNQVEGLLAKLKSAHSLFMLANFYFWFAKLSFLLSSAVALFLQRLIVCNVGFPSRLLAVVSRFQLKDLQKSVRQHQVNDFQLTSSWLLFNRSTTRAFYRVFVVSLSLSTLLIAVSSYEESLIDLSSTN